MYSYVQRVFFPWYYSVSLSHAVKTCCTYCTNDNNSYTVQSVFIIHKILQYFMLAFFIKMTEKLLGNSERHKNILYYPHYRTQILCTQITNAPQNSTYPAPFQ